VERVAFIVEETGERVGCLLNPESVVLTRRSGVEPQTLRGGLVTGSELADDPLRFTGGGTTRLALDLVFDVSLAGSTLRTEDVRALTGPLWSLTENTRDGGGRRQPPVVRFVWGKAWNLTGVITAIAERLEHFTAAGVPERSWVRLTMLRVDESAADVASGALPPPVPPEALPEELPPSLLENALPHELGAGAPLAGEDTPLAGERLDQLAYAYYGDPALWRLLALANGIADPLRLAAGTVIQVPTTTAGEPV
jgi:hypothetical protein